MKLVYEVLEEARKKRAKADKIKVLKDNETWALKDILRGSTDTTVTFNLPAGAPPYTPSPAESVPTNLLKRNKLHFNILLFVGCGFKSIFSFASRIIFFNRIYVWVFLLLWKID